MIDWQKYTANMTRMFVHRDEEKPHGGNFFINGLIWLNNNEDQASNSLEFGISPKTVPPIPSSEDYLSNSIVSDLDLEDWTRLWIYMKGMNGAIQSGQIRVGLKWSSTTNIPGIKIVQATNADGGMEYLYSTASAQTQCLVPGQSRGPGHPRPVLVDDLTNTNTNIVPTSGTADFVFPTSVWSNLSNSAPKTYFLFEGTSRGEGQLQIVFLKSDGTTLLSTGGSLWVDIRDIKEMYQRAIASGAGPNPSPPPEPYATNSGAFDNSIGTNMDTNNRFIAPFDETAQCVIFVHGWYTDWNEFTDYSETLFKRLWWQGYKGRLIGFTWPALSGDATFNPSEWNAWLYGKAFKDYVTTTKAAFPNLTVIGHSQGNVVIGSAIQEGLTIPTYILLQAALPTGCYTTNSAYNAYQPFLDQEDNQQTPDLAADLGYRGFIEPEFANVGHYYCFYNPQDYALATGSAVWGTVATNWEANQEYHKPDVNPGQVEPGSYSYTAETPSFLYHDSTTPRIVNEIHESMSFVARPRSQAAGADINSPNVFGLASSPNLYTTYGFTNAEIDHSGEFLRNYDQVYSLYQNLEGIIAP